jgi:hypothetical protein
LEISIKDIDEKGNLSSSKENASISLDKLSLSSKANQNLLRKLFETQSSREHYSVNKEVNIVPNPSLREKGYRYVSDVYYEDEIYLQLAFCPVMDLIPNDQLKIKISNHVLYQHNWVDRIDYVLKSLKLECHSVTEMHIALDAPEIAYKFLRLYYQPSFQLVRDGLFGKHNREKRLSANNGFHFNKRSSDLYFTFYNKSADYIEKPYIKEFHECNDLHGNIHRIEMRARKPSSLKLTGITWQDLGDTETLLQIFQSEFQSRIAFNDTRKRSYDNNRNKKYLRVHPIDFPSNVGQLTKRLKTKPSIENMKSKKNTVKILFMQTVKNPNKHNVLSLKEMIEQNNLSEWFKAKRNTWVVHSPETVEVIISLINEQPILPEPKRPSRWIDKLLFTLVIVKFPEWNFESLSSENHLLKVA